ncbi:uncharacterized protein Tco025E_06686 [Trypanosoma conorhini]|uniref:Transmembrane protein n=1 Tax=Trypanosoma conorhini TaxID=83891 RepID=A0A3R7KWN0_9TRYP|nr:uncharacterized protein Tco025E_06686 [Trypanosoma conorhini]RNF11151.1 hypothetical protein Tco025E_06686 [Trypanosoma conorhini]
MAEEKSGSQSGDTFPSAPFAVGFTRPKSSGTSYTSAGGGEAYFNPADLWKYVVQYFREEASRQDASAVTMVGPDYHFRPPQWMEDKNVSIDGTPLTEEERRAPNFWQAKYRQELDVGEAIQEVKRVKRMESAHDVIGSIAWVGRRLGWMETLDEEYARQKVKARYRALEKNMEHDEQERAEGRPVGARKVGFTTPWKVILESVETGQPIAKVANEYRPSVDFYGLDPFLDSAPSLIWFTTKCGIAMGIAQGMVKAIQAINVDVQFLNASGVGVLSILNMSVFASVVKWGGNCALFSAAFCVGDRLATMTKHRLLPPHDARRRSTSNYVMGLAMSGATVGVMPWWILGDVSLALRLGASGFFLGGCLGLGVGTVISRLVALNTARLEATNRELRRYEALMRRQRKWADGEREKLRGQTLVWW